jgi:hydroxyacylglutathione hydrolase
MLEIVVLPVLSDNYIYLVHDCVSKQTAVIDPALAEPVLSVLAEKQWQLTYIYNTHHHSDHVGGNLELKKRTGCRIFASEYDRNRIPGIDATLTEGDKIYLGNHQVNIFYTPGHTLGHIVYYFISNYILFCGDTLFAMGCGRLFEGTAQQMWSSLQKLKVLPEETLIYCTHEYAQNNAKFALTLEPNNAELQQRMSEVQILRAKGMPTLPATIGIELKTNPFLREDSAEIQASVGLVGGDKVAIFAAIRSQKDRF